MTYISSCHGPLHTSPGILIPAWPMAGWVVSLQVNIKKPNGLEPKHTHLLHGRRSLYKNKRPMTHPIWSLAFKNFISVAGSKSSHFFLRCHHGLGWVWSCANTNQDGFEFGLNPNRPCPIAILSLSEQGCGKGSKIWTTWTKSPPQLWVCPDLHLIGSYMDLKCLIFLKALSFINLVRKWSICMTGCRFFIRNMH